eukprot:2207683-Prymnesium_polylepis.1
MEDALAAAASSAPAALEVDADEMPTEEELDETSCAVDIGQAVDDEDGGEDAADGMVHEVHGEEDFNAYAGSRLPPNFAQ